MSEAKFDLTFNKHKITSILCLEMDDELAKFEAELAGLEAGASMRECTV